MRATTHDPGSRGAPIRSLIAEPIARGANINYISSDDSERTLLWNAVAAGELSIVQLLIEKGADVTSTGSERYERQKIARTFAPRAAFELYMSILRLLLSSGIDVNARYPVDIDDFCSGRIRVELSECLLQEAALLREDEAVEVLLEYSTQVDFVSPSHGTALMLALSQGEKDAAHLLLAKGADHNFNVGPGFSYTAVTKFN